MGEHTKKTRILLALLALLCVSQAVLAQTVDSAQSLEEQTPITQNSEINYPIEQTTTDTPLTSGIGVGAYIRMLLVLIAIVIAILFLARFLKKNVSGTTDENPFLLRKVASISLGAGKSVQVVTLLDKNAYLVGVTEESVNLLGTIDDVELIQALNLNADQSDNAVRPKSFADVLELFTKKTKIGRAPLDTSEEKPQKPNLTATLDKLRGRLNGDQQ